MNTGSIMKLIKTKTTFNSAETLVVKTYVNIIKKSIIIAIEIITLFGKSEKKTKRAKSISNATKEITLK